MAFSGAVAMYSGTRNLSSSRKPYTAVTVQIDNLTSEAYEVDDSTGIVDLIEAIRIQSSGPTEAARALRKKLYVPVTPLFSFSKSSHHIYLTSKDARTIGSNADRKSSSNSKYGDIHRQLRALTLLDLLIQNAGPQFTSKFADEPLLERLRIAGSDITSDPQVKQKCKVLFAQWSTLRNVPGMARVAALYSQLPRKQKPIQERKNQSKVLRETEYNPDAHRSDYGHQQPVSGRRSPSTIVGPKHHSPDSGGHKSKKDRKHKHSHSISSPHSTSPAHSRRSSTSAPSVTHVRETLANARIAADGLMNALRLVNRERESVSENAEVIRRFNECKTYRRQILKYIHGINDEDYLGSLLTANEELVNALMSFEVLERGADDDDSDSEVEAWTPYDENQIDTSMAGMSLEHEQASQAPPAKPPRPGKGKEKELESESESEEEDDDNPFGDKNAI
ncbi:putative actin patch assembly and actin polymerization protein [Ascosphaera aggregata]|nr:putative actin patch assembly and actin polymerization protein [Ascosphaera aggregata]